MPEIGARNRYVRVIVGTAVFLAGFGWLVYYLISRYLRPAYRAWADATPQQRELLSASSLLLLSLIMTLIMLGLVALLGIRRLWQPDPERKKTSTVYVDAWQESARRMRAADRRKRSAPDDASQDN